MPNESDDRPGPLDSEKLRWQWDDADDSRVATGIAGGGSVSFEPAGEGFAVRADPSGSPAWTYAISDGTDAASLVADGQAVYVALYRGQVSGARMLALDPATGRPLWEVLLLGLGPLHHSKYANRVQLRLIGGRVVAFGNESGRRYIEARDPHDGALIAHRVVSRV